ncbi:hypothetical protein N7493_000872 [Penicillium malachiteum]|uniref:Xylanolytic transcriptional activator regulatory domain-containing protein n=1 Tax=Penicillium malachiteum TaxID=1324776 RepID=A0AAD6HX86_9EURO|nr:hypothetical protein N7493_000872 [Penicillium malachiteum]
MDFRASDELFNDSLSHLQEITNFMDSAGLLTTYLNFDSDEINNLSEEHNSEYHNISDSERDDHHPGTPFRSWLPSAPLGDSSLATVKDFHSPHNTLSVTPFFNISRARHSHVLSLLSKCREKIPDFILPSRHALTRYLTSFWETFHPQMPFIHLPTTSFEELSLEEILGYSSMGAQYRFERRAAESLFFAGRALVLDKIRDIGTEPTSCSLHLKRPGNSRLSLDECSIGGPILSSGPIREYGPGCPEVELFRQTTLVGILRSSLTLMAYSAWESSGFVQESMRLRNVVIECLEKLGMQETNIILTSDTWKEWARTECCRRAQLVAYCFVHTLGLAYNHPPAVMARNILLRLPCGSAEWGSATEEEWKFQHATSLPQMSYKEALSLLLSNRCGSSESPVLTPLGSYMVLHGLIQQIYLLRELSELKVRGSSVNGYEEIENALRNWTSIWQATPESTLDPRNENGLISFTSSALLGMAYIRLHLDTGPYRRLETRSPDLIACSLCNLPTLARSPSLIPALLYAVHALSIPVRLGIDFVARSQASFWSMRHALASFESAVFLAKWLDSIFIHQTQSSDPLSDNELRMLHWVRRIVHEYRTSADVEEYRNYYVSSISTSVDQLDSSKLGIETLLIWSRFFRQNVQWPFINIMGLSLETFARKLQTNQN